MDKNRYSSIDFLRFAAAYTVAITHLTINHFQPNLELEIVSSMAVEVFFIISGFVLAPQIIRLATENIFSNYKIFLIRRWYRTIPLYVLSLLLTSLILNKFITLDLVKYLLFIQNFFHLFVVEDYFSISWSLSVEEWVYIIFPLFLIIISFFFNLKKKNLIIASLFFIILIFLIRFFFANHDDWGSDVRRIVLFRLDSIAFGFLLYFFKDLIVNNKKNLFKLFILFLIVSLITFKLFESNIEENLLYLKLISHYVIAIWGSSLLIFVYLLDKYIVNKFLIKMNFFLGKISYSTYLFHLLLIYIIGSFNEINFEFFLVIFTVSQVLISIMLFNIIENPILKSRPNLCRRSCIFVHL